MTGASIRFPHLGIVIEHLGKSISIFGFDIAYYGIIIGVGMLCGIAMAVHEAKRTGQNPEMYYDFALCAIISAIVGCRIYYVAFEWSYYSQHPLEIFNLRQGGLAIYGGIIGGFICMIIFSKIRKASLLLMADTVVPGLLIGQIIGRWGNFFNQEAFGTNTTTAPFRMWSLKIHDTLAASADTLAAKGMDVDPNVPVHPTFLYESVWCILGFFILNYIVHKRRKYKGEVFLLYGIWYGLERMVVEGLRTDSLYVANTTIRVSQLLSAIIVVAFLVMHIINMVKLKKGTLPQRLSLATAPATANGANAESVEKIKDNNDERENEDVTNN